MPALFEDQALVTPPDSGLGLAPGANVPGVGLADDSGPNDPLRMGVEDGIAHGEASAALAVPRLSPRDEVRAKFDSLSGLGKVGAALSEFGAGVAGRTSPMQVQIENERKNRLLGIAELKENVSALEHGVSVSQKLSGDAKTGFIDDYAAQLDKASPGLGKAFKNVSAQPGLLEQFKDYMPYLPEPMKLMAQQNPQEFLKIAGTDHGLKAMENARDQYLLKIASKKTAVVMQHLDKFGLPEDLLKEAQGKTGMTASLFNRINDHLPEAAKLTEDQLAAAKRHPDIFYGGHGIITPKKEEEIKVKAAEQKGDGALTGVAKAKADLDAGRITDAEYKAIVAKETHIPRDAGSAPPSGYEVDPADPTKLRPKAGGPADQPKRDKLQMDALAMYRAEYPMGKVRPTDPTAESYVADYIKKKGGDAPAPPAGAPMTAAAYQQKHGKPPPSIGNKAGFDRLKKGDGYVDSRDGQYKVKG